MLDSAAPQDQVRVRFLEHSWPSSLVFLAWPFQGLVVSIPELQDHHPSSSPSSALPAWHRNRTQLASFMERCTGAPFWPQRQVSCHAGFFLWGPGIFRGSLTLRSPAAATSIPNHVPKYSDHCTPCQALASDTRSNKPILSQHDSRFLWLNRH